MSEAIFNSIKRILFQVRWLVMSDQKRYAYLWKQTREGLCRERARYQW